MEVIIALIGLTVAGLAAVLGIWVERDPKTPRYAYALSVLILLATIVGMFQTYMDAKEAEMESDMARMLAMLDKIAADHGDTSPELNDLVKTEIAVQSRANPSMVAKVHSALPTMAAIRYKRCRAPCRRRRCRISSERGEST